MLPFPATQKQKDSARNNQASACRFRDHAQHTIGVEGVRVPSVFARKAGQRNRGEGAGRRTPVEQVKSCAIVGQIAVDEIDFQRATHRNRARHVNGVESCTWDASAKLHENSRTSSQREVAGEGQFSWAVARQQIAKQSGCTTYEPCTAQERSLADLYGTGRRRLIPVDYERAAVDGRKPGIAVACAEDGDTTAENVHT